MQDGRVLESKAEAESTLAIVDVRQLFVEVQYGLLLYGIKHVVEHDFMCSVRNTRGRYVGFGYVPLVNRKVSGVRRVRSDESVVVESEEWRDIVVAVKYRRRFRWRKRKTEYGSIVVIEDSVRIIVSATEAEAYEEAFRDQRATCRRVMM